MILVRFAARVGDHISTGRLVAIGLRRYEHLRRPKGGGPGVAAATERQRGDRNQCDGGAHGAAGGQEIPTVARETLQEGAVRLIVRHWGPFPAWSDYLS